MAVEDPPLEEGGGTLAPEPIVPSDSHTIHDQESHSDCRDVAQQYVAENVVPPTLSEMRQNMLRRQLNNLIQKVPEVQHPCVPDNK